MKTGEGAGKKVSIIVPAYNAEKYLSEALESVCRQTYSDWELIGIDDGSTDRTLQIFQCYAAREKRICFIYTENQGVSHARNVGLQKATGEYILFLDADDILPPWAIEKYVVISEKDHSNIVIGSYREHLSDGSRRIRSRAGDYRSAINKYKDKPLLLMLRTDYIAWNVWGKLFRRTLLENHLFDESLRIAEDMLFMAEVLFDCSSVSTVEEPCYEYYIRDTSTMGQGFTSKNMDTVKALYEVKSLCKGTPYEKASEVFFLKYTIWIYGLYLRSCSEESGKHCAEEGLAMQKQICSGGIPKAFWQLGWKKKIEYLSIRISPGFYKLWIQGAYLLRDRIWSKTKRG